MIRELAIPADSIFYPESKESSLVFERNVIMLRMCNDKELSIIATTLGFILDAKYSIEAAAANCFPS